MLRGIFTGRLKPAFAVSVSLALASAFMSTSQSPLVDDTPGHHISGTILTSDSFAATSVKATILTADEIRADTVKARIVTADFIKAKVLDAFVITADYIEADEIRCNGVLTADFVRVRKLSGRGIRTVDQLQLVDSPNSGS
jgi:hypothetical protein